MSVILLSPDPPEACGRCGDCGSFLDAPRPRAGGLWRKCAACLTWWPRSLDPAGDAGPASLVGIEVLAESTMYSLPGELS